jgi:hypothetical protein
MDRSFSVDHEITKRSPKIGDPFNVREVLILELEEAI